MDDPEMLSMRQEVENYQARLDLLGLKDHHLRQPVNIADTLRRILFRSLMMLILLPFAIPGALLHLPVGWLVAIVGERFSYEMDDVATLKVFATLLVLPMLYVILGIGVGVAFGLWWGIATMVALPFSFFASVRLMEAEAGLFVSILSLLRVSQLGTEVEELRETRAQLAELVRTLADERATPGMQRMFTRDDFGSSANVSGESND